MSWHSGSKNISGKHSYVRMVNNNLYINIFHLIQTKCNPSFNFRLDAKIWPLPHQPPSNTKGTMYDKEGSGMERNSGFRQIMEGAKESEGF